MKHKYKILIVTHYFRPENLPINYVADLLASEGNEVDILTGKPNYPEGKFYKGYGLLSPCIEFIDGFKIYRLPIFPRGKRFRYLGLILNYLSFIFSGIIFSFFYLRKAQYDLIFVYGTSPVTNAIPAIFLSKLTGSPIKFWVQDLWPESITAQGFSMPKIILNLISYTVNKIYQNSDLIACQSKSFIQVIHNQISSENLKLTYLPNVIDEMFLNNSDLEGELPSDFVVSANKFNVIFTGNISEAQSLNTVIDAAEIIKSRNFHQINFVIIGSGSKLNDLIDYRNSKDLKNVQFTGAYPLEDMPQIIKTGDALLVSLKSEEIFSLTIPNKLQSYLASGKPILGSLNGEGAKAILEGRCGLAAEAESAADLAEITIDLFNLTSEERAQMGRNSFHYFESNFAKDKFLHRFNSNMESLSNKIL